MLQQSLFDGTDLVEPVVARARRADPETSHIAAEQITKSGKIAEHHQIIAALVRQYPGLTTGELSEKTTELSHEQIWRRMSEPVGFKVDHWDGDTLNNRRSNLRVCSNAENIRNMRIRGGSSRFKGVYWNKSRKNWRAQIMLDRKKMNLGGFDTEIEAAKKYDAAALRLFGEFARLNFPNPVSA